jgi:hypothetical protein
MLQVPALVRQALSGLRLPSFLQEPFDRLRPGSGLSCCCFLFEVGLSAAERLDRFLPGAWGCNARG